jgi:hypothetical protein
MLMKHRPISVATPLLLVIANMQSFLWRPDDVAGREYEVDLCSDVKDIDILYDEKEKAERNWRAICSKNFYYVQVV